MAHERVGRAGDEGEHAPHFTRFGVGRYFGIIVIKTGDAEKRPVFQPDMIRYLVLPSFYFPVFIDAGDGDQAACSADTMPEGSFVLDDLFATGVDHRSAHGLYLFGVINVLGNNAPLKILPMVLAVLKKDHGITVVSEGHEMH